jgi:hypothetical protein
MGVAAEHLARADPCMDGGFGPFSSHVLPTCLINAAKLYQN